MSDSDPYPSVTFHREPPEGTLRRRLVDSGIPRGIAATVDSVLRADGYRVVKVGATRSPSQQALDAGMKPYEWVLVTQELT